MNKNKLDKKAGDLDFSFENILVCNEKRLRPFVEIMVEEPENVTQQHLGTLLGVFEIADISEDSSYIVNYLISIIKKEYFSHPKRGAVESFESALRKANLALSKLAEHGSINWLGKLNALCAVMEKGRLHFAQTGTVSAFLFRSKNLTDISEGLSPSELEPNPLKTFDNISSGKLEKDDKLIIATESVFDIFSFEEIKKSALRFDQEQFVQFLKTALGNQLEKAAVLVIDAKEKIEPELISEYAPDRTEVLNAFSSATFVKPARANATPETIDQKIQTELGKGKEDQKTGHIYIKGEEALNVPAKSSSFNFSAFSEKLGELGKKFAKSVGRALVFILASLKSLGLKSFFLIRKLFVFLWGKAKLAMNKKAVRQETPAENDTALNLEVPEPKKRLLPDFSKLLDFFSRFNYEQKIYAVLIVLAILIIPYFIARYARNLADQKAETQVQETPAVKLPLEQDKNVTRIENLNASYAADNIFSSVNLNGKIFAVSQGAVADIQSSETFPLPENFGQINLVSAMADLNLIFLVNTSDKKIISWSPISKKFQDQNLAFPENSKIAAAGTYLTYIYLIDSENSRIYRYPRAEGGFGASASWLKDEVDLSQVTGSALSDNIYLSDGQNLIKLFKGKKQDFQIETTDTPIAPFKVYTKPDSQNIFVLDKINARIIKLDLSGNILAQYYNSEIGNANDFTVDEANNSAYFSTSDSIKSFRME